MTHVIRRLEHQEIELSETPSDEQVSPLCAREIIDSSLKYGCTRDGEWFTYKRTNNSILKCGGWVGSMQVGNRQIEVRPKIENVEGADTEVNLVELLIKSGVIEAEFREVANLADRATAFELLALWYARKISKECNRGLSRGYVELADNIPSKRGRIDFSREWMNKSRKRALLACCFDEHSEDNQLNRILKAGLRAALSTQAKLPECRIALGNTLKLLDGISDVTISAQAAAAYKPDRKDLRFKPLLKLAVRFISNKRHQDVRSDETSSNSDGLSLMWSAWRLFETFVYRELSGENQDSDLQLPTDKWSIKNQVSGRHMIRRHGATRGTDYILKPDIIIYDSKGRPSVICDTKWKYDTRTSGEEDASAINGKRGKYIVKKSDLYQMFAYSRFYTSGEFTPSIALIYPSQNKPSPAKGADGPLSFLTKVDTLYFNIGENGTQTAVDIYEFPVPTVVKPIKPVTA